MWMKAGSRMWPQLALLYLLTARPAGSAAQVPDLPFSDDLDSNRQVMLQWGFDAVQGNITFKVSIKTSGWIGFGLSPNGDMLGADMVIGGVGTSGIYFTDRHGVGKVLPIVDSRQSYELLSMTEVEGRTSMTFRRAIQTCDDEDFHITPNPIKLIYAYGETDEIEYHGTRRGTKEVNLLQYKPRDTLVDSQYFDMTMDNFAVPDVKTHYHCKVKKMPHFNETHHVYRIKPLIDNVDLVHHMVLYGCPQNVTEDYNGGCYLGNIVDHCFKVMAAWAVGGGPFELPAEAGIPIGGSDSDMRYRLEIHYNNPTSVTGRRDNSGLRLYYTAKLRRYHAGTLSTGLVPTAASNYKIPPGATQFRSYGMCNTSLFSELVDGPVPDLHVFTLLLHTHLAGRKVRAALFREGKQVEFLGVNENYDFDRQDATYIGHIKIIRPNDVILVECTYDTTNRQAHTTMGLATTDEMCLAYLLFYPDMSIHTCWSTPDMTTIHTIPEDPQPADQEAITHYENELRTHPQIQMIRTDNSEEILYRAESAVLTMEATPKVHCRGSTSCSDPKGCPPTEGPVPSRGTSTSCIDISGGTALLLLLLWSAAA